MLRRSGFVEQVTEVESTPEPALPRVVGLRR